MGENAHGREDKLTSPAKLPLSLSFEAALNGWST